MKPVVTAASLVLPGLWHVSRGKFLQGASIWVLFLLSSVIALLSLTCKSYVLFYVFVVPVAVLWLYSGVTVLSYVGRQRRRGPQPVIDAHFDRGLVHYLRDELNEAEREFEAAVALDLNDSDAWLHLATIRAAQGCPEEALRALKQCRVADEDAKWEHEVAEALNRLESAEQGAGPGRSGTSRTVAQFEEACLRFRVFLDSKTHREVERRYLRAADAYVRGAIETVGRWLES